MIRMLIQNIRFSEFTSMPVHLPIIMSKENREMLPEYFNLRNYPPFSEDLHMINCFFLALSNVRFTEVLNKILSEYPIL